MAKYDAQCATKILRLGWVVLKTSRNSIILERAKCARKMLEREIWQKLGTLTYDHNPKFNPSSPNSIRFLSLPQFLHQIISLHMLWN
jgi:hypothetical protein